MATDNKKEKSAQEPEENHDLIKGDDDWATSLISLLSPYEENEDSDSTNSWD